MAPLSNAISRYLLTCAMLIFCGQGRQWLQYMHLPFMSNFGVSEKMKEYSVPHCSRLIRQETGVGFAAFVRNIKMNHAVSLLRNSRIPVSEISSIVGYENPESFIRSFQKVYHISPTTYRKQKTDTQQT